MPSVRFSRDKRGYEYVYLMHTPTRRGKPGRAQVIYWYRTPPGVRVGREPFSEDVQRLLEAQHPGVTFDWPAIINTPMPPPDMTEFWREKRRAAKAAKEERRAQEAADAQEEAAEQAQIAGPDDEAVAELAVSEDDAGDAERSDEGEAPAEGASTADGESGDEAARKRRRRRGGRRRRSAASRQGATASSDAEAPAAGGEAADGFEAAASDEPAPKPTEPLD